MMKFPGGVGRTTGLTLFCAQAGKMPAAKLTVIPTNPRIIRLQTCMAFLLLHSFRHHEDETVPCRAFLFSFAA
jgi:hypothetical protein